ncbi:MAG TPA: deoxyribose-phosphate aldolase [Chroococcales cyanobacterium]
MTREIFPQNAKNSVSIGNTNILLVYAEENRAFWDTLEHLRESKANVTVWLPRYAKEVFQTERLMDCAFHFEGEPLAKDLAALADYLVVASLPRAVEHQLKAVRSHGPAAILKDAMVRHKQIFFSPSDEEQAKRLEKLGFTSLTLEGKSSACDGKNCQACGKCVSRCPSRVQVMVEAGASRVSSALGASPAGAQIGRMIDHTLLKADATESEVTKLCDEARRFTFASVCVNPTNVAQAAKALRGCPVKVCTVIGFPLGATTPEVKAFEARNAIENGAGEIDMVINIGALKSQNYRQVENDIRAVVGACHQQGAICKVILETGLLSDEEKVAGCALSKEAGADFVKTSTGFSKGGATVEDIALMRLTVGKEMGVKASGGVRDFQTAAAMVKAGATRIGASASVEIVQGKKGTGSY